MRSLTMHDTVELCGAQRLVLAQCLQYVYNDVFHATHYKAVQILEPLPHEILVQCTCSAIGSEAVD